MQKVNTVEGVLGAHVSTFSETQDRQRYPGDRSQRTRRLRYHHDIRRQGNQRLPSHSKPTAQPHHRVRQAQDSSDADQNFFKNAKEAIKETKVEVGYRTIDGKYDPHGKPTIDLFLL